MTDQQRDWLSSTNRLVPVLLMISGWLGFCACVAVALISVRTDLLALAGLCATVATGTWASQAYAKARSPQPPPAPLLPVTAHEDKEP